MLQWNEVEMMMMRVLMMKVMVMMIPMKSSLMVVTMAMISPSLGGISPADFCLPESFLLSVFHVPQRRRNSSASLFLGFLPREDEVREVARPEVGQGGHTLPRHAQQGPAAPRAGVGPLWPTRPSPFGSLRLLVLNF